MKLWRPRKVWLVAATMGLAACAPQTGQDTAPTTTSTTAASTAVATDISVLPPSGPVEPGTYHVSPSAWSVMGFTVTLPEGWETQFGAPGAGKISDPDRELYFYFVIVDAIYSDPCEGPGELMEVGPGVDDLAEALQEQLFTVATEPVDRTVGGLPAKRIELTVPDDLDAACRLGDHLQIWYSAPVDKYFVLFGDGTANVYILDVKGERQVLVTQYRAGTRAEDIAEMQNIIESIKIDP